MCNHGEPAAMRLTAQLAIILFAIDPADIEELSAAQRQRLADLCRHVAAMAEPPAQKPKAGVLASLHDGERPS
jgi:hypothetical protein